MVVCDDEHGVLTVMATVPMYLYCGREERILLLFFFAILQRNIYMVCSV